MNSRLQALEAAIGYHFKDRDLILQALTHRSYSALHNERLEFLGDSILNAVAARLLFDAFPLRTEGELSRLRSSLVKQDTLAELALKIGLNKHLRLGEGEARSGGFQRPSILADVLEAVIAAIFLEAGFGKAEEAVAALLRPLIASMDPDTHGKDNKTLLQEWLQARKFPLPSYKIVSQGANFVVSCELPELKIVTQGIGSNRRIAEQEAAGAAIRCLLQH